MIIFLINVRGKYFACNLSKGKLFKSLKSLPFSYWELPIVTSYNHLVLQPFEHLISDIQNKILNIQNNQILFENE